MAVDLSLDVFNTIMDAVRMLSNSGIVIHTVMKREACVDVYFGMKKDSQYRDADDSFIKQFVEETIKDFPRTMFFNYTSKDNMILTYWAE